MRSRWRVVVAVVVVKMAVHSLSVVVFIVVVVVDGLLIVSVSSFVFKLCFAALLTPC